MKQQKKLFTIYDIINELRIRKIFLTFSFLTSLFIVLVLGYYKSYLALPSLSLELQEQYFPVTDEIKDSIRMKMVSTFTDINELQNYIDDKEFKKKILNNYLIFNFDIKNKNLGKTNIKLLQMNIKFNKDESENYKIVFGKIKNLILNVELKIRNQMGNDISLDIDRQNEVFKKIKGRDLVPEYVQQVYMQRFNLEKNLIALYDQDIKFFTIYPSELNFSKSVFGIKEAILICLLFMVSSVSLVILNRFFL